MQSFGELPKHDLYLRFSRRKSTGWERLPSIGKYCESLSVYPTAHGTIYVQGTCTDLSGKILQNDQLIKLVGDYGVDAIKHLDGRFVIAVDDKRTGVWCAADCAANFPIYYRLTADELIVTSRPENMKLGAADDLDPDGIMTTLISGFPWGNLTLLKNWKVLRPGQIILINRDDNFSLRTYFDPEGDEEAIGFTSERELLEEIDASLVTIASQYKKILIPLSGGADSRLICVRCHALGIPFETITFVANASGGDDFDVAARLSKVFGVKHHRWEWRPQPETCISNFIRHCVATGGTNDAFTSYPDGMDAFGAIASQFDCILRGDHVFGYGPCSHSIYDTALIMGMNVEEGLDWARAPKLQDGFDPKAAFEKYEDLALRHTGSDANEWKHKLFRITRSPQYLMPIGRLLGQHVPVVQPLLTRRMIQRMSRTDTAFRDTKQLAVRALESSSPEQVRNVPFASRSTWKGGEPLLNLPDEVIQEMIRIVKTSNPLSSIVDDMAVTERFTQYIASMGSLDRVSMKQRAKQFVKKFLPKAMLGSYKKTTTKPRNVPSHMVFKRYFAMKAFISRIS